MSRVGFFEEAPGVKSSTRLMAFLMILGALGIVSTICFVAIAKPTPEGTIAALSATLLPLVGGVWAAVRERVPSQGDKQ